MGSGPVESGEIRTPTTPSGVRIGADVGGTFTDVVLQRLDGTYASTKVLTTHDAPERAILDGVERLATDESVDLAGGAVGQFVHGTTLATNALIERRGARTAFVTTAGFRDVIETRTESRFEQYDLDIVLPHPPHRAARPVHRVRATQCPRR